MPPGGQQPGAPVEATQVTGVCDGQHNGNEPILLQTVAGDGQQTGFGGPALVAVIQQLVPDAQH
jgi:hypothetical protein